METVAKIIGADFELTNAVHRPGDLDAHVVQASTRLLEEIKGYPTANRTKDSFIEYDRRFLSTSGASFYIDSDHLEANLPEHASALEHPAILHGAGLAVVRQAQVDAQARLPTGTQLFVAANCSDGKTSWGSHLNMLVTRACFRDILGRKPHVAGFLATHFVTSIPFTGQGLVGAANNRGSCPFQLSQRADWFVQFASLDTMRARGLINVREEPHAGGDLARLHMIFYDMVLSPVANILKAGTTQLVVAMIEQGWADPALLLDDPVSAASEISRDLSLRRRWPTSVRGRRMSAVEMQVALCELAAEFVAAGHARGIVPGAEEIVALWRETLDMLEHRAIEALAKRCDAWLKYLLIEGHRSRKGLTWQSPQLKVLDQLFASLDPHQSLFFQMAGSGQIERMPSAAEIARYRDDPPDETRAYLRAHLLRRYGRYVESMHWDAMRFRVNRGNCWWSNASLEMPDPRAFGRSQAEPLLADAASLEDLVEKAALMRDRTTWPDRDAQVGSHGMYVM